MRNTPSSTSERYSLLREATNPFTPDLVHPRGTVDSRIQKQELPNTMKQIKKILLVEDDKENRLCLRDFLQYLGYECCEAEHGKDGLVKLHAEPFDLVITDLNMPIMNGYQLIDALDHHPPLSHLPVLIVTGESISEVSKQATSPRVKAVLPKPYDFPRMTRLLETLFA